MCGAAYVFLSSSDEEEPARECLRLRKSRKFLLEADEREVAVALDLLLPVELELDDVDDDEDVELEPDELLLLLLLDDDESPKNARRRAMVRRPDAELLLDEPELDELDELELEPLLLDEALELRLLRLLAREPRSLFLRAERRSVRRRTRDSLT